MRLCLVPMKPLARAKLRLSGDLTAEQRRALSLAMLEDVVRAARALDEVWVVNSDAEAVGVAEAGGARAVPDPTPEAGLNPSLDAVTEQAVAAGAEAVLVLSADLPCVTADDVRAIADGDGVALAPDRAGSGTNALWRRPPRAIPLAFGEQSRAEHERLARAHEVPFRVVARDALSLDADRPEDLRAAWAMGPGPATRAALEALGYGSSRESPR